jgi:hypothetical protein
MRERLEKTLEEARSQAIERLTPSMPVERGPEPPVVARLMVEIRSDGTQTIARGAVEDVDSGERVAIEARGTTPAQLAGSLAKTLFATPLLARAAVKAVLDAKRARPAPTDDDSE